MEIFVCKKILFVAIFSFYGLFIQAASEDSSVQSQHDFNRELMTTIAAGFYKVNFKLEMLEGSVNCCVENINSRLNQIDARLNEIDARLKYVEVYTYEANPKVQGFTQTARFDRYTGTEAEKQYRCIKANRRMKQIIEKMITDEEWFNGVNYGIQDSDTFGK